MRKAVDKDFVNSICKLTVSLTFHQVSLVVAVIVAVCGSVVDVEALDWSVVVTRRVILREKKREKNVGKSVGNYGPKRGHSPPPAVNGGPLYQ